MPKGFGMGPSKEESLHLISDLVIASTDHYDHAITFRRKLWEMLMDVYHLSTIKGESNDE
jgi:hypothetical protein